MNIKISQNIPFEKSYEKKQINAASNINDVVSDAFIPKKNIMNKNVSFSGGFLSSLFKTEKKQSENKSSGKKPSEFAIEIANTAKHVMECDIPAENLDCLISPDEFREILPSLAEENFISSKDNQIQGIYCADLDNQTTFSLGEENENVYDILDMAAEYANKYYLETGKDFIFAITDRDSLEGIQHALRIIASCPEKYKHLKILPGIKMSFAHEAPNSALGYENSDMLIYGINPYSQNLIDFVDTTINKRKKMMVDFIKEINKMYPEFAYTVWEFSVQNDLQFKKSYGVSNLYWRAREYAEIKGGSEIKGIQQVPENIIKEANAILDELDKVFLVSEKNDFSGLSSDITGDEEVNKNIKQVFLKYSTHFDEDKGKAVSPAENLYEDMIDCLGKEKNKPVLALSAPYYYAHHYEKPDPDKFDNVVQFFKELQKKSNGMLLAFESAVPSYNSDKYLSKSQINKFNDYIREHTNLYEVGGSFSSKD